MVNNRLRYGMLVMVLALGFWVVGCDDGGGGNGSSSSGGGGGSDLAGTAWEYNGVVQGLSVSATFYFIDATSFSYTEYTGYNVTSTTGTYTVSGNKVRMTSGGITYTGTISGNKLITQSIEFTKM